MALAANHPEVIPLVEELCERFNGHSVEGSLSALAMLACFLIENVADSEAKTEITFQFLELVAVIRNTDPNIGGLRTGGRTPNDKIQ